MPSVMNTAVQGGGNFNLLVEATRDVYSSEIWFAAMPIMKFDQFSTKKTELGTQPGKSIQLPKYSNLKRGGRLKEGERIKTNPMSMSHKQVDVAESGNGVAFSEFLLHVSFYDQLSAASLLLGRDVALVLDMALRDAGVASTNVIYANSRANRAALVAGDNLTTAEIDDAVEDLQTANAPMWAGQYYICFIHPHQLRQIRNDSDWVAANHYAGTTAIFTGEVGMYNGVRFVATTIMPNGANASTDTTGQYADPGYDNSLKSGVSGNQTTVYKALMFGEYSIGHALGLPVELRDNGSDDFGREHAIAWYSIWGEDRLEEPNLVRIETA